MSRYDIQEFPNLEFEKTSEEIIKAVTGKLTAVHGKLEAIKKEVTKICNDRGVDATEVLDAGKDEDRISTYSNKMSDHVSSISGVGSRMKEALETLNKDLKKLREYSYRSDDLRREISDLDRIKNNLSGKSKTFFLNFDEITELGFN